MMLVVPGRRRGLIRGEGGEGRCGVREHVRFVRCGIALLGMNRIPVRISLTAVGFSRLVGGICWTRCRNFRRFRRIAFTRHDGIKCRVCSREKFCFSKTRLPLELRSRSCLFVCLLFEGRTHGTYFVCVCVGSKWIRSFRLSGNKRLAWKNNVWEAVVSLEAKPRRALTRATLGAGVALGPHSVGTTEGLALLCFSLLPQISTGSLPRYRSSDSRVRWKVVRQRRTSTRGFRTPSVNETRQNSRSRILSRPNFRYYSYE
jgi:hypothetical protein